MIISPEKQEDAEVLLEGIEPSSSPLDFFANVRRSTIKGLFVEKANKINTYRAIEVAKRRPEFGTKRHDGGGVFDGLNEQRYIGLDLLDDGIGTGTMGGVTPVVTGELTRAL